MGLQREEVANRLVKLYNLPLTPEEYMDLTLEHIRLLMADCQKMPGNTITSPKFDQSLSLSSLFADTEGIYEGIIGDIAKSFKKTYARETRLKVLGTTEQKTAEIVVNDLGLPCSVAEFRRIFSDMGHQRLGNAPLLRGTFISMTHTYPTSNLTTLING